MKDNEEMTPDERKELLTAVTEVLSPEYERQHPSKTFLPLRLHEQLLTQRPVLVVGERGVGKTAVFRFLRQLSPSRWQQVFPGSRLDWVDGYSNDASHPVANTLHDWAKGVDDQHLDVFWLAHLAGTLWKRNPPTSMPAPLRPAMELWRRAPNDVRSWVPLFAAEMPALWTSLDATERDAAESGVQTLVGYDDLDTITVTGDLSVAARLCARLVAVWVTLSTRWRAIQGRVFLRPDLADKARSSTTDASKLRQATLELSWSAEDLFRVLTFRLGTDTKPGASLRAWLERDPAAVWFRPHPVLGWVPPEALPDFEPQLTLPFGTAPDWVSQERVATRLAGKTMGSGTNKGYTRSWILNHSRDALERHLPRLTLNLIRNAAEVALGVDPQASGLHLLLPSHLEQAQGPTGTQRREELQEQYGVVGRLEALRGVTVPLERSNVVTHLAQALPGDRDPHGADGEAALRELVRVGLLLERNPAKGSAERRVDMPDLFRKGLEIRRKGGPLQLPAVPRR